MLKQPKGMMGWWVAGSHPPPQLTQLCLTPSDSCALLPPNSLQSPPHTHLVKCVWKRQATSVKAGLTGGVKVRRGDRKILKLHHSRRKKMFCNWSPWHKHTQTHGPVYIILSNLQQLWYIFFAPVEKYVSVFLPLISLVKADEPTFYFSMFILELWLKLNRAPNPAKVNRELAQN